MEQEHEGAHEHAGPEPPAQLDAARLRPRSGDGDADPPTSPETDPLTDSMTVVAAAEHLGLSVAQVRRLALDGVLGKTGRGMISTASVLVLHERRQGSGPRGEGRRVWGDQAAWAAIATLSGVACRCSERQRSRIRGVLRSVTAGELLDRVRGRARIVRLTTEHSVDLEALRETLRRHTVSGYREPLIGAAGIPTGASYGIDAYVPEEELQRAIEGVGLREDATGTILLRSVSAAVASEPLRLAGSIVLQAIDAADCTDPHQRRIGRSVLERRLQEWQAERF